MGQVDAQLSTGMRGLDNVLKGLIPGDNLVWQVDSLEDYKFFLRPYLTSAKSLGRKMIYFRFGGHEPLVKSGPGVEIVALDPLSGFEKFITDIHRTIGRNDRGSFYVFDSLSDLAADWYSDQMLGNFFMLTCPYLYDVDAIAYFAIFRGHHSSDAVVPIHETAQVIVDVFRHRDSIYIQPHKVQQRHSTTMFMLHAWDGERFQPVTESAITSEIMMHAPSFSPGGFTDSRTGYANRAFYEAEELLDEVGRGNRKKSDCDKTLARLLRMVVSRDERMLRLAEKHFTLTDVLEIRNRMIGTGLIGGKSVGMLVARAILKKKNERLAKLLEAHDSFYIGSDVFYTYVVRNGSWWIRERQRDTGNFFEGANEARRRMMTGNFPESIRRQFSRMLDYFGQSPIIVRSSSLLEDNYGNAFSGKYESVFCANQGAWDRRLEDFMSAVRTIYMSTFSENALSYRAKRGLLDLDEQMALLVQRVSGSMCGRLFFPQVAGVGYSYNPYVWSRDIDPRAGMLRIVFGLGTRAVDRRDDDYTRVVALNAPERRPESNFKKVRRYAQRKMDVLDLDSNQLTTVEFEEAARACAGLDLELFASMDEELSRETGKRGEDRSFPWVLTFDKLLKGDGFVADMRELLGALEETYGCPVDTEFTANFFSAGGYKINLLQCRPLQAMNNDPVDEPPFVDPADIVLDASGAVIGKSRLSALDWIVHVPAGVYGRMPAVERYAVARLIGRVMRHDELQNGRTVMLLGPGRWGSSMPELGVPVSFAEINAAAVLGEIVAMNENIVPDVSLGTHFFNDLVEAEILYLAIFVGQEDNILNEHFLSNMPNRLAELLPEEAEMSRAVRVISAADLPDGKSIRLNANIVKQRVICYIG
jgi:pyruvate, water dikinase